MNFETYESANAPEKRRFCCTLRMHGNPHMLTFMFGATQEEAERKAQDWIDANPLPPPRARPAKKTKPTPIPEAEIEEAI